MVVCSEKDGLGGVCDEVDAEGKTAAGNRPDVEVMSFADFGQGLEFFLDLFGIDVARSGLH